MPYTVTAFEPTPNPDALKCLVTPGPLAPGQPPRSYPSRDARLGVGQGPGPAADPVADALFAIPGVRGLLIHHSFITVSREPGASWRAIKAAIKKALAALPEPADAEP